MSISDKIPTVSAEVVARVLEKETVLVLPTKGKVKVLNEVGTYIWGQIDGSRSAKEIAATLCEVYNVEFDEAETDVIDFLNQLVEREVITLI